MKRLQRTTVNITGLKCQKCRTCLWTMCGLMTSSCALAVEQTFYVFVYEIAENEVRYRYGLMGASMAVSHVEHRARRQTQRGGHFQWSGLIR